MERFHVVYASDDNFAMLTGISMFSLLENNRDLRICVHILANGIGDDNKRHLETIAAGKAELHFIDVSRFLDEKIKRQRMTSYASGFDAYSRICVAQVLPDNISKVLYLDGDTVINGSLSTLASMDLSRYACAMVKDIRTEKFKKRIQLENEYKYYNSGVMLINLDYWRKHNIGDRILDDILHFPTKYAENCAFCRVLKGHIKALPLKYNVTGMVNLLGNKSLYIIAYRSKAPFYSETELNEARDNPIILHYTNYYLSGRPWFEDCFDRGGTDIFNTYFTISPFAKSYVKPKKQYAGFKRKYVKLARIFYRILPQTLFTLIFERAARAVCSK